MSIAGLVISLLLLFAALWVTAYPLIQSPRRPNQANGGLQAQTDRVQAYYARALTNISDLDEDFAAGKISEADYQEEREVWAHRGIQLLRVQAQLEAQRSLADSADAERIDRAIEAAVLARRVDEAPTGLSSPEQAE